MERGVKKLPLVSSSTSILSRVCCATSSDFELVNKIISFILAPKPGDFRERGI
ncbi:hypothetical protein [Chryseobacterium lactis]|uniref:hypothetical protein n=1 Tax=Chryseobacterium lactis TaxID=1241981 RepID=UPI0013DDD999|nr:hypothetical protein [Chryseobacterium lactis]